MGFRVQVLEDLFSLGFSLGVKKKCFIRYYKVWVSGCNIKGCVGFSLGFDRFSLIFGRGGYYIYYLLLHVALGKVQFRLQRPPIKVPEGQAKDRYGPV